jgi:hypothetical protein
MSSLQNKLTNYEVIPPPNVWDKVAAALDESELDAEFPSKLYNTQIAPPAMAWENIQAALEPVQEEARIIPLAKKRPAYIRYAIAAIFIAVAALGIVRLVSKGSSEETGIAGLNGADTANKAASPADLVPTASGEPSVPVPDKRDMLIAETVPASKKEARKSNLPRIASALYTYNDSENDQYINPLYDYNEPAQKIADRYIMLMTPEGTIIRMSKKLGNLVCCVSGEEQDADCKTQLKKWQEKLATSPADASSGNFLDILSLVNSLEQGTEL